MESLLEKLVEKEHIESDGHRYPDTPEEARELLPQISSNAANAHEEGPVLSLIDHSAVSVVSQKSRCVLTGVPLV